MKKAISVLLAVVVVLTLCSCVALDEKAIIGTWKNQNTVLGVVTETEYVFNEDGTGSITNLVSVPFTHSFEEGKLIITTSTLGIKNTTEYSYDFEKDSLTLTDDSDTIKLEKVK